MDRRSLGRQRCVWREWVRRAEGPLSLSRWRHPDPPVRQAWKASSASAPASAFGGRSDERNPPLLFGLQGPSVLLNRLGNGCGGSGRRGLKPRGPEQPRKRGAPCARRGSASLDPSDNQSGYVTEAARVGAYCSIEVVRNRVASTRTPASTNGTPRPRWSMATPAASGKTTRETPPKVC